MPNCVTSFTVELVNTPPNTSAAVRPAGNHLREEFVIAGEAFRGTMNFVLILMFSGLRLIALDCRLGIATWVDDVSMMPLVEANIWIAMRPATALEPLFVKMNVTEPLSPGTTIEGS